MNYDVAQGTITEDGWKDLATCDANDANTDGTSTKGLYNKVTMDGDSDQQGTRNNDACVPVTGITSFQVAKVTSTTKVVLQPGDRVATVDYLVTVKNGGSAVGTSAPVLDVPATRAGFTVTQVLVDGVAVIANATGAYQVTAGDKLNGGQETAHTVKVVYAVNQTAVPATAPAGQPATGWEALGTCTDAKMLRMSPMP